MFASKHPFRDTLVIEIDAIDILRLHGGLVRTVTASYGPQAELLSILEAFHAGTDMSSFERPCDTCDGTVSNHSAWCDGGFHDDPADDQLAGTEDVPYGGYFGGFPYGDKRNFRNHGEEIADAIKTHSEINKETL